MLTPHELIAPPELRLDQVVQFWANRIPDRIALELHGHDLHTRITWRELDEYILGMVEIIAVEHQPGDVIGIVCDDSVSFHVLINALWGCGATVFLISRAWGHAIVNDLLKLLECKVVYNSAASLTESSTHLAVTLPFPQLRTPSSDARLSQGSIDDLAMIASTSGTTDNPKCVGISHRQIRTAYRTCHSIHNFSHVQKTGCVFAINGLGVLGVCYLLAREVGAGTCVFPAFDLKNIQSSWRAIITQDIDFVYLVPPVVRLLNSLPSLSSDRRKLLCFCASAPVTETELRKFEEKYPVECYNSYGLTELTFAVFFGCRERDGCASSSIGSPIGIEAKLIGDDGSSIVGAGRGEIYIRGPMLTDGYICNTNATQEFWVDGWLRTGDLAERDGGGRYYVRGRMKDAVLRGGVLYYFHELEHYLLRCDGVIEVCAFKGRGLASGDELCLAVHAERAVGRNTIIEWIRENLGDEKLPNAIFMMDAELPRNSNGKILRNELSRLRESGMLG